MDYVSPLEMLYHWETNAPDKVYLRQPVDNVWLNWTWKKTAEEVRKMAMALKEMQLPANSNIAIISKNCAHWIICDLAIMMSGHTSVPLYPNLNANNLEQILEHSGSKVLFIGKLDDWPASKAGVPNRVKCICFPFCSQAGYETWEGFIKDHQPLNENIVRNPDDIATIIYTSGTTGIPKGVMHKFRSLAFVATNAIRHLGLKNAEKFFSYLPLSHVAERILIESISLYTGAEISFAESLQSLIKNLAEAKPTVFLGVHRIWSRFQQGMLAKIPQKKLDVLLKVPFVSAVIKRRIRKTLGLTNARNILTGAAPTPVALIKWFETVGINIQEAYAMTENCCYSHVSVNKKIKIGYVGQPLPNCQVKLGENDEILIKHDALMAGYYKDPQTTKQAFSADGFLRTGDQGFIDQDEFLKITGRVKEIFKTSKGKYVSPAPIEMKVCGNADVGQVCVVGTGLPQPIALITLSENGKGKTKESMIVSLNEMLALINSSLEAHEKLDKIVVLIKEWTVENGLLTPSFKIKRNEVEKKHYPNYEKWYSQKGSLIFEN
jgi:long-chain acyl-CoA synthetase